MDFVTKYVCVWPALCTNVREYADLETYVNMYCQKLVWSFLWKSECEF